VNEVKSIVESINRRLDQAEKRICKLKGHLKFSRGEKVKKSIESLCELWDTSKQNNICFMGVPEAKGEEGARKLIKKNNG